MKTSKIVTDCRELSELCKKVRKLALCGDYEACEELIRSAMNAYPHAPHPHNLYGILLEMEGDHFEAMKHFRAACALEPTYKPSSANLDINGSNHAKGRYAFDESDCPMVYHDPCSIVYDENGIGRVVRRA